MVQCAAFLCDSALKWLDKVLQTDVTDDIIAIAIGGGSLRILLYDTYKHEHMNMQHSADHVISGYPGRIYQRIFL